MENEYDVGSHIRRDSSKEICSSTFLTVKVKINNENKNWLHVFIITFATVTFLTVLSIFLVIFYKKRKTKYTIPSMRKLFNEVS